MQCAAATTHQMQVCVCECIAAAAAACCSSLYYLPTELAQTSSAPHQEAGSIEHLLCMHSVVLRGLSSLPMNLLLPLMTNMKKKTKPTIHLQLSLSNLHKHLGAALALCCCCYNNCKHTYRTHSTYTVKRVHTHTFTHTQSHRAE